MWLQARAFDIVSPQHTHNQVKKQAKIAMNISEVINLDKKLEVFSVGGLPTMIVFTVVQVSIRYCDSFTIAQL